MSYLIGKVYKIVCGTSNECYVGATYDRLSQRFYNHKVVHKAYKEQNHYASRASHMFDKYGINNCRIVLIKEYQVIAENKKDRRHLSVYESLWIYKLRSVNVNIPAANILCKKYLKMFREKNKQEKVEYSSNYYRDNKEILKPRQRDYYNANKENILKKQKIRFDKKIECSCGENVRYGSIRGHLKSKRHKGIVSS